MELSTITKVHDLSYHYRHGWQFKQGYIKKKVFFWVDLNLDDLVNPFDFGEFAKGKKKGKIVYYPDLAKRGGRATIPDDTVEYALGISTKSSTVFHDCYLKVLESCYKETKDEAIAALLSLIPLIREAFLERYNPKEIEFKRLIFTYKGNRISSRPEVYKFWVNYFKSNFTTTCGHCAITNKVGSDILTEVLPLKLSNVANSLPTGTTLLSFSQESSQSYGWVGLDNFPCSLTSVVRIYSFLNELLRTNKTHLKIKEYSILLWGNNHLIDIKTLVKSWHIQEEIYAFQQQTLAATDYSLAGYKKFVYGKLFHHGNLKLSEITDNRDFHIIVLKGNSGRTVLWEVITLNIFQVVTNIAEYLMLLKQQDISFWAPLTGLADFVHNPVFALEIFLLIFTGNTIGDGFITRLINHISCHEFSSTSKFATTYNALGLVLIKLYYHHKNIRLDVFEDATSQYFYNLGRLFKLYISTVKGLKTGNVSNTFKTKHSVFLNNDLVGIDLAIQEVVRYASYTTISNKEDKIKILQSEFESILAYGIKILPGIEAKARFCLGSSEKPNKNVST